MMHTSPMLKKAASSCSPEPISSRHVRSSLLGSPLVSIAHFLDRFDQHLYVRSESLVEPATKDLLHSVRCTVSALRVAHSPPTDSSDLKVCRPRIACGALDLR